MGQSWFHQLGERSEEHVTRVVAHYLQRAASLLRVEESERTSQYEFAMVTCISSYMSYLYQGPSSAHKKATACAERCEVDSDEREKLLALVNELQDNMHRAAYEDSDEVELKRDPLLLRTRETAPSL